MVGKGKKRNEKARGRLWYALLMLGMFSLAPLACHAHGYEVLLDPVYDSYEQFNSDTLVTVYRGDQKGIVSYEGVEVVPCGQYVHVYPNGNQVMAWAEYPLTSQSAVTAYTYQGTMPESEETEYIYPTDLDINLEKYDSTYFENYSYRFSDGLCAVVDAQTELLGYIDMDGNEVIPCQFPPNQEPDFHNGYAPVYTGDFFLGGYGDGSDEEIYAGMIDKTGKLVVDYQYARIVYVGNGMWACYNTLGATFHELRVNAGSVISEFDEMDCFSNFGSGISNVFWVKKDGKWGLVRITDDEGIAPVDEGFTQNGNAVTGTLTVQVSSKTSADARIVIPFYTQEGALAAVHIEPIELQAGDNIFSIEDISFEVDQIPVEYKSFVWSDLTLTPLMPMEEFTFRANSGE